MIERKLIPEYSPPKSRKELLKNESHEWANALMESSEKYKELQEKAQRDLNDFIEEHSKTLSPEEQKQLDAKLVEYYWKNVSITDIFKPNEFF